MRQKSKRKWGEKVFERGEVEKKIAGCLSDSQRILTTMDAINGDKENAMQHECNVFLALDICNLPLTSFPVFSPSHFLSEIKTIKGDAVGFLEGGLERQFNLIMFNAWMSHSLPSRCHVAPVKLILVTIGH